MINVFPSVLPLYPQGYAPINSSQHIKWGSQACSSIGPMRIELVTLKELLSNLSMLGLAECPVCSSRTMLVYICTSLILLSRNVYEYESYILYYKTINIHT